MDETTSVLVAGGDARFVETVAGMLGSAFKAVPATGLTAALDAAERQRPPIVLIDDSLVSPDGAEPFASLRKLYSHIAMQALVLVGAVSDASAMIDGGADDFLAKPFDSRSLGLRLKAVRARLRSLERIVGEREFYRQAVRQEENLTIKLLDKQIGLKETLADLSSKKVGLEMENRRLAAAARFDVLTGVLNRQSLNARLELETRRASETRGLLCGLMMDLDKFKAVNDSFGHLAGDDVLRVVGDALRSCLRREDFAGRYGGEEFFVLLPGSGMDQALAIADRIRVAVAEASVDSGGSKVRVTASLGVAAYSAGESVAEWVGRADAAMYRAKQLGRDRVET